jgi:hypothetical protein
MGDGCVGETGVGHPSDVISWFLTASKHKKSTPEKSAGTKTPLEQDTVSSDDRTGGYPNPRNQRLVFLVVLELGEIG